MGQVNIVDTAGLTGFDMVLSHLKISTLPLQQLSSVGLGGVMGQVGGDRRSVSGQRELIGMM